MYSIIADGFKALIINAWAIAGNNKITIIPAVLFKVISNSAYNFTAFIKDIFVLRALIIRTPLFRYAPLCVNVRREVKASFARS